MPALAARRRWLRLAAIASVLLSCGRTGEEWNGRTYDISERFGPEDVFDAVYDGVENPTPPIGVSHILVAEPASRTQRLHPTLDKWLWQQCKKEILPRLAAPSQLRFGAVSIQRWFEAAPRARAGEELRAAGGNPSTLEASRSAWIWQSTVPLHDPTLRTDPFVVCTCLPGEYTREPETEPCSAGVKNVNVNERPRADAPSAAGAA